MQRQPVGKETPVHDTPLSLLPKNLFDLTDLFLNFAGYLLIGTFSFQLKIVADFPGDLPDLTLHLVKCAFRLVLCAGFHDMLPFLFISHSYLRCRQ
jgi:hypothetical protein